MQNAMITTMKVLVVAMVLLVGCSALAQEMPRMELQAGYAFTNLSPQYGPSGTMNGWTGSLQFNVNRHLGFLGEAGGSYGHDPFIRETHHTYLFGPRVYLYRGKRVNFFGNVLLGPGYLRISRLGAHDSARGFASAMGGGVDLNLSRMFAVRLGQTDYLFTRYVDRNQSSFRFSSGLVLRFGGGK